MASIMTYLSESELITASEERLSILQEWLNLLNNCIHKLGGNLFLFGSLGALKRPEKTVDFAEVGVDEESNSCSLKSSSSFS